MNITTLFPTAIVHDVWEDIDNKPFVDDITNFFKNCDDTLGYCETLTTTDKYNLTDKPIYDDLIKRCKKLVLQMSTAWGVQNVKLDKVHSWGNLSKPGNYQEAHIHEYSHFSVVYYAKTPKKSGNIVFSKPIENDMFPVNVDVETELSAKKYIIEPKEGMVVAFRSNLSHLVTTNLSNQDRISIAMNFVLG
jgi:uncharacterized protein (TIGR02466 family)